MSDPLIRADQINNSVSGTSSFNIFEPADDDLIRVGYISTTRGYLKGIDKCEANRIAKKDPGTQFILQTRDFVKYLNINEVNALTIEDLQPEGECPGINMASTGVAAPSINLSGGGGVGARAVPIVGNDGKILSAIVTHGGFGYKYPPKVNFADKLGIGAGVVAQAFTGNVSEGTIVFDAETDFEEYQICDPGENINSPVFDVSGKEVNKFDAKSYFSKDKDPSRGLVLDYQKRLREADRKPFWSTRMNPPLRVIGEGREDRTKYDVVHHAWGGAQVKVPSSDPKNFEDVQFKIFTSGGHDRGMAFRFASEDGSHKFTIKADDFKENTETEVIKRIKRNTKYFVTSTGRYKGQGVEQGLASKLGKKPKEIKIRDGQQKEAKGDTIFCDFAKSANDNDDLQIKCKQGIFTASNRDKIRGHDTYQLIYTLGDDKGFKPEKLRTVIDDSFMNRYAISPVPPSNVPGSDFAGIQYTFEWEQSFPYDGEYKFKAMADNISQVYIDNELVLETKRFRGGPDKFKMFVSQGTHTIRVDLFNIPQERELVVTETVETQEAKNEIAVIYKGMSKGAGLKQKSAREVVIDDDIKPSFDENASFRILSSTNNARFSKDGKKIIYDGSGSITIRYKYDDNPRTSGLAVTDIEVGDTIWKREFDRRWDASGKSRFQRSQFEFDPNYDEDNPPSYAKKYREKGRVTKTVDVKGVDAPPPVSGDIQKVEVFDTLSSINKADRKLYRISNLTDKTAGFINRYGISPFDLAARDSRSDDYGGTHTIRWYDLDFPVDGNYNVEIAVDDNVNLRFVNRNQEETTVEMKGFVLKGNKGIVQGKSSNVKFFRAGKYTLIAELFQRSGKPLAKGNPMALAIRIGTSYVERTEIVKQSWNENPMGAALTIDAPPVPNLQLPIPKAEGRCPNNPFWTTRFPAKQYWYPVVVPIRWGKFMNRHAISPIPPLARDTTDGGGVVYTTSWDIDVPYRGFFGLKSTVDNGGRILIDGVEVARGGLKFRPNDGITGFRNEPDIKKIFIEEGKHEITVELINEDTEAREKFKQKVFSTADWAVQQTITDAESENEIVYVELNKSNKKIKVSNNGREIGLRDGDGKDSNVKFIIESGNARFSPNGKKIIGSGRVKIKLDYDDNPNYAGEAVRQIRINDVVWNKERKHHGKETKTVELSPTSKVVSGGEALTGGTVRQGVTYEGPALASYRSGELGAFLTPAFTSDEQYLAEFQGTTWNMKWNGVNFPEDGAYTIRIQADDIAKLRIDGQEVASDQLQLNRGVSTYNITQTAGKKTVEIELFNQGESRGTFSGRNPTVVGAIIDYNGTRGTGVSKSWDDNPIGISAELIPPPCPKDIEGKGVVTNITIIDPGNGFTPPPPGPPDPDSGSFPVSLQLDSVTITGNPINYNCGVDQLVIEPANGAVLSYECDTFGRITKVNVESPGSGFQTVPNIRMITDTGTGFSAVPNFKVVVDPLDETALLQVTDLPGIKRTGFVNGRSYYGAVYIEGGLKFAGFFATVGTPVQVYDTLQESIDAEVTTPPSAIQRQGTDIRANDPRLDIPDTPDQLI